MNIVDKEYLLKSIICSLDYLDYRSLVYKLNHRSLFITLTKFQVSPQVKKLLSIKNESKIVYDDLFPENRIMRMVLLKDNKLASNGDQDNTITIWETKGGLKKIKVLSEHITEITILFVMQDNNLLTSCLQRVMIIWHHSDFTILHKIQNNEVLCYVIQNSFGQLITGHFDGIIRIWESRKEYNIVNDLLGHEATIILKILPLSNGDIVSSSFDETIRFWSFKSNYACIRVYEFAHCYIQMTVGEDDLVAAYAGSKVFIFDQMENYNKKIILEDCLSRRTVSILKFLQDKYLAFGCPDGSLMILNKFKGNILYSAKEHDDIILFLFVHKNNTLISGSRDKIVLRDMEKNFRTIAIIYLEMNSALVLENRILFSELDSLNMII
jgi:WD40 repeat protein